MLMAKSPRVNKRTTLNVLLEKFLQKSTHITAYQQQRTNFDTIPYHITFGYDNSFYE